MYTLTKDIRFEAAHRLPNHDGKCERLHGHSWHAILVVQVKDLYTNGPQYGMGVDFGRIKEPVEPIVEEKLDHHFLNETLPVYPTSERIAKWLYDELDGVVPCLHAVRIEETCTSSATYCPDARISDHEIEDTVADFMDARLNEYDLE